LSTLLSVIIFRENLSSINKIGIVVSILSIILISNAS
jgi:multidrug transporter EmrE-like cation transporter